MEYVFALVLGYLFGCINPATVIAKIKKVDIRNLGSKNPGASNVFITVGKGYGVIVGICDILKSFIAGQIIFSVTGGNTGAAAVACAMAVFGHNFPFWMKFNGGKGFAPFMGFILFYDWKLFLILVVAIAAIILITDYISIATFSLSALMIFSGAFETKFSLESFPSTLLISSCKRACSFKSLSFSFSISISSFKGIDIFAASETISTAFAIASALSEMIILSAKASFLINSSPDLKAETISVSI
jgi:glycerol-3-phosphate acyltransferase PlsY